MYRREIDAQQATANIASGRRLSVAPKNRIAEGVVSCQIGAHARLYTHRDSPIYAFRHNYFRMKMGKHFSYIDIRSPSEWHGYACWTADMPPSHVTKTKKKNKIVESDQIVGGNNRKSDTSIRNGNQASILCPHIIFTRLHWPWQSKNQTQQIRLLRIFSSPLPCKTEKKIYKIKMHICFVSHYFYLEKQPNTILRRYEFVHKFHLWLRVQLLAIIAFIFSDGITIERWLMRLLLLLRLLFVKHKHDKSATILIVSAARVSETDRFYNSIMMHK